VSSQALVYNDAMSTYNAFLVTKTAPDFAAGFQQLTPKDFPAGEVLIRVAYSSLNYKDGLAVTGKPGVIRQAPMVPGIDLAGVVEESASPQFKKGDEVVVTGCGTAEWLWGGYAQLARLNADVIVPLPKGMTLKQAMGVGTAGFTAMQSVMELERHGLTPGGREVLVTGAGGGVGSVSVAILAKLGYKVVASSGRAELAPYLKELGAADVIDRSVLSAPSKRPMESERWGGVIDSVGGDTLAGAFRTAAIGSYIAVCGLAGGASLNTTVYPFILRGVSLLGIDSVRPSNARRREIWSRLLQDLSRPLLDSMIEEHPLSHIQKLGELILAGQTRGRMVIDVNR
jgi:acrylyl-CoA reductase (NADPH)